MSTSAVKRGDEVLDMLKDSEGNTVNPKRCANADLGKKFKVQLCI
jgi:hypothetical protein